MEKFFEEQHHLGCIVPVGKSCTDLYRKSHEIVNRPKKIGIIGNTDAFIGGGLLAQLQMEHPEVEIISITNREDIKRFTGDDYMKPPIKDIEPFENKLIDWDRSPETRRERRARERKNKKKQ